MAKTVQHTLLYTLLLTSLIWLIYLALRIWRFSFISERRTADVAVVLGTAVTNDQPSPVFAERINHGIQLYHEGTVGHLIFTGGYGSLQQLPEAIAAQRYANDRGVPIAQTAIETVSRFTHENIQQAEQLMQKNGWRNALVVSDPLHMRRAMTMAKHAGLNAYPAPTPTSLFRSWHSRSWFLFYETICYATYLLLRPFMRSAAPIYGSGPQTDTHTHTHTPLNFDFSIFSVLTRFLTRN